MYHNIPAIITPAFKFTVQIFDFSGYTSTTAAAAGNRHIFGIGIITGKSAAALIKRFHAGITNAFFLHDVTLNYHY